MWRQSSTFHFTLGRFLVLLVFYNVHLIVSLFEINTDELDVGDSVNGQSSDIALHLDTVKCDVPDSISVPVGW